MDEIDKETIHLLIFLFMQFLSRPDQVSLMYQIDIFNISINLEVGNGVGIEYI